MDFGCDEIKCISLIHRTDKRNYFSRMMTDNNLSFSYFDAIEDKDKPSRGCFRSHAKIISDAYKKRTKRLLVFEDDAFYNKRITDEEIDEIRKFLDNEDWEIFLLGSSPNIWTYTIEKTQGYNKIYKGHFLDAGAYILNRKGIKKYKNLKWGGDTKVIDKDVFMKNNKAYTRYPRVYNQRLVPNDISYGNSKQSTIFLKARDFVNRIGLWYALNINIKLTPFLISSSIIIITLIMFRKFTTKSNKTIKNSYFNK